MKALTIVDYYHGWGVETVGHDAYTITVLLAYFKTLNLRLQNFECSKSVSLRVQTAQILKL